MDGHTNTKAADMRNFQNSIYSKSEEELKQHMQTEIKKLNAALLVNSEQHLKRQSERVVILNRRIQKLKK